MSSMSYIQINDIFDEMSDENKGLIIELISFNKCLNVLIRFKSFIDIISDNIKHNLDSNNLKNFEDLNEEVEQVLKERNSYKNTKTLNKTNLFQSIQSLSKKRSVGLKKNIKKNTNKTDNKIDFNYNCFEDQYVSNDGSDGTEDQSFVIRDTRPKLGVNNESVDLSDRIVCDYIGCGRHYSNKDSMREHYKTHFLEGSHKCEWEGCNYRTWNRLNFEAHTNAHKGIRPFVCNDCGKGFSGNKLLKNHVRIVHSLSAEELICQIDGCNKRFRNEVSFRAHQKMSHLLEKKFGCDHPNCEFKAVSEALVRLHKNKKHTNERPFMCSFEDCPKTFKNRNDFTRHLKCHSSERNYKCLHEGCHKTFKDTKDLKNHQLVHSNVKISCDWPGCDFETTFMGSLRTHQLIHSSDRNFSCDWPQCNKTFKRKQQLIIHLRIHNCDKRYACHWPGCLYRCVDSTNLSKHLRVHRKT